MNMSKFGYAKIEEPLKILLFFLEITKDKHVQVETIGTMDIMKESSILHSLNT